MSFYEDCVSNGGEKLFATEWYRHKRLLQPPLPRKKWIPKRMKDKAFYRHVFRVSSECFVDWAGIHVGATRRGEVVAEGPPRFDRGIFQNLPQARICTLQAEYLQAVLSQHGLGYYKLLLGSGTVVYHVLHAVSASKKYVKTGYAKSRVGVYYLVQKQEFFKGSVSAVYPFEDPEKLDLLTLAPFDVLMESLHVCTVTLSDVGGCMDITSETQAKYRLGPHGVLAEDCPEVIVMQAAVDAGWMPGQRRASHLSTEGPPATFLQHGASVKWYLQVLLSLPSLRAKGLERVELRHPQSYYRLLLKVPDPGAAPPRLSDKCYKLALEAFEKGIPLPPWPDFPAIALPPPGAAGADDSDEIVVDGFAAIVPDEASSGGDEAQLGVGSAVGMYVRLLSASTQVDSQPFVSKACYPLATVSVVKAHQCLTHLHAELLSCLARISIMPCASCLGHPCLEHQMGGDRT